MDKKDKFEQFIKDQINSIEVNEEDRMWEEYQKKFGFPKSKFPYIFWLFFLTGTILTGYWAINNVFHIPSQYSKQNIKTGQDFINDLLIKEKVSTLSKNEVDVLIEDEVQLHQYNAPAANQINNNHNSNRLESFEKAKEGDEVNTVKVIKGFNEVDVLSKVKAKVNNEETQSIIDADIYVTQTNNFSSKKINSSENEEEVIKDFNEKKDKEVDKREKAVDKASIVKVVNAVDVANKSNVLRKNENAQFGLLNELTTDNSPAKLIDLEARKSTSITKEAIREPGIEEIKKIEPKKPSVLEQAFPYVLLPGFHLVTENKISKPWFIEYQFSRSFNGIQQQSSGIGKTVYKKSNKGLDIIAGLQYDFGYSVSMDSAIITRKISIFKHWKDTDLNYLVDAFITSLYTYEYQRVHFAAGVKINYGIFNQYIVDEGIAMIEHSEYFNRSGYGSSSNWGLKENNNWRAINKLRFNAIVRVNYQRKRFAVGLTASKQINSLIKNNLAASNKSNIPVQLGWHVRFNF